MRLAAVVASTTGRNTATAAVLLMNADNTPTSSNTSIVIGSGCRTRAISRPIACTTPLADSPLLRTNIAATVLVAGLEKPYTASAGVTSGSPSRLARQAERRVGTEGGS